MNIQEIKDAKQEKFSQLVKDVAMFFAFSTEQFNKNKTPLKEGEKYVSLGAGAYIPKGNVDAYLKGIDIIDKWYKAAIKSNKARKANILYELNNHEAFYTCDITDTLEALGEDYTAEEVQQVFNYHYRKQVM